MRIEMIEGMRIVPAVENPVGFFLMCYWYIGLLLHDFILRRHGNAVVLHK
jgi:hypothetical protein